MGFIISSKISCHPICKKSINEKNLDGVDDPDIPTSEIVNILDRAALSAKKTTDKQTKNNLRKKTNNCKWFDNDLRSTGSSVVDYIILSEELLTSVLYFKVSDFIPIFFRLSM